MNKREILKIVEEKEQRIKEMEIWESEVVKDLPLIGRCFIAGVCPICGGDMENSFESCYCGSCFHDFSGILRDDAIVAYYNSLGEK